MEGERKASLFTETMFAPVDANIERTRLDVGACCATREQGEALAMEWRENWPRGVPGTITMTFFDETEEPILVVFT